MRTGGNDNLACRTLGKGEHEEMDCTIYKGKDKHACRMFGEKKRKKKKKREGEVNEKMDYTNYEKGLPRWQTARKWRA